MKKKNRLIHLVRETIEKYRMVKRGDKVLVSCSGGPDSVALTYILASLSERLKISLHIVYVNHNLRRDEVEGEKRFIRRFGKRLSLPYTIRSINARGFAKRKKLNIQDAARELRYKILVGIARKIGASKIALGHTASDQVETVILHLIRGSGIPGLGGMFPTRDLGEIGIKGRNIRIIRPVIDLWRHEIADFLKKEKLDFCKDSSNEKLIYLRNKVRKRLLPILRKEYNPEIDRAILRLGEVAREEVDYWRNRARSTLNRVVKKEGGEKILFDLKAFNRYNKFPRKVLLYYLFEGQVNFSDINIIDEFAKIKRANAQIQLKKGLFVRKEHNQLIFGQKRAKADRKSYSYKINVPGCTSLPEIALDIETSLYANPRSIYKKIRKKSLYKAYFDAERVSPNHLVLRSRKDGDRFHPFGMEGSKKVKDYFIDEKVPHYLRYEIPILESGKDIIWIVGRRQSEKGRITKSTNRVLEVTINQQKRWPKRSST